MTQNSSDDFTYDELNFDGLERRGNYRTIAYREDVLHALDRKDPAAIIYQIVFRWQTEFKKPEVLKKIEERKKSGLKPYTPKEIEDMMYVFMSYNDFVRESGGAIGYNTVIRMLDYLINTKKVLYQRENHNPKYPDFEYSVNKNAMRQLLKALPIEPVFAPKIPKKKSKSTQMGIADNGSGYSTQMGIPTEEIDSTQMGTQSTHLGSDSTQMGTEVYPNGGTSHNYSHTTHNEHTEGEDTRITAIADDATPSPSLQQFFTPTEECMCMYCQRVYKNSEIAATPGDLAPCGHDKNALFDIADNPQVNGEDDGTHNRHDSSRAVGSNDDDVIGNPQSSLEDPHRTVPAQQQTATPTEKPQLNRLTNPPEPPTQQNVSTDESPREIASETANDTPSLPVVESVVIHADARNDVDSYSPPSTAETPTQETTPAQPEAAETPATGKGSGKRSGGKGGNKKTTKPDLSPIAPPARPAPDLPFNAEKILAWGDYGRGMKLPESPRRDSRAYKAREAARIIDGKAITEDLFLTLYFNWMKGIKVDLTDLPEGALKSDTWPDYPVDLWVFAEHFEEERKRYNTRKKESEKETLKEKREKTERKAALDAASRAKKNDEFYEELRRTRREA